MRAFALFLIVLLLSGCQEVVDISALPDRYKTLFRIAAERQGVGTDSSSTYPWEWRADLGDLRDGTRGRAIGARVYCRIRIDLSQLGTCVVGGDDQRFIQTARHEIGHCQGEGHSSNPQSYMHAPSPCWSID